MELSVALMRKVKGNGIVRMRGLVLNKLVQVIWNLSNYPPRDLPSSFI